jgi:hypothetical protein
MPRQVFEYRASLYLPRRTEERAALTEMIDSWNTQRSAAKHWS